MLRFKPYCIPSCKEESVKTRLGLSTKENAMAIPRYTAKSRIKAAKNVRKFFLHCFPANLLISTLFINPSLYETSIPLHCFAC